MAEFKELKHSRRFWKFAYDGPDFTTPAVAAKNGVVTFRANDERNAGYQTFDSTVACLAWLGSSDCRQAAFVPGARVDLQFSVPESKQAVKLTSAEWKKVQAQMKHPESIQQDQVVVFEDYLANSFVNRQGERVPLAFLKQLAKTMVGKQKLNNHDWDSLGDGRVYAARVDTMSAEEYRETLNGLPYKPAKIAALLADIEGRDGALGWLVIRYYMLNVTAEEQARVRQIQAGLGTDISIGFNCAGYDAVYSEDGKTLKWWEFTSSEDWPAQAMEASHCFLGRQYGAGVVNKHDAGNDGGSVDNPAPKNINGAQGSTGAPADPVVIPDGSSTQAADGDGANGGKQEMIKILSAVLGFDKEVDGTDEKAVQGVLTELQTAYEGKLEAMQQLQTDLDAAKVRVQAMDAVFGENVEQAVMQQANDDAKAYRTDLIEQTTTMGNRVGMIGDDEVDGEKEQLQSVPLDQIKKTLQRYEKLYNDQHPTAQQTADGDNGEPEMIEVSASSAGIR